MNTIDPHCEELNTLLVGQSVERVIFVRDYLQLDTGAAMVNLNVWPEVIGVDGKWSAEDPGYRNALAACIGSVIEEVRIVPDETGALHFDDGRVLEWSLSPELGMIETVVFRLGNGIWIW